MAIIVEGIDRVGKGTFIQNIIKHFGNFPVVHSGKPVACPRLGDSLEAFQREWFEKTCSLAALNPNLILDRYHLGEVVYAPIYRKYSGQYVFDFEPTYANTSVLFLLVANPDVLSDDGNSLDYTKRYDEQDSFRKAFLQSRIVNKVIIETTEDGVYRDPAEIFADGRDALLAHFRRFPC